MKILNSIVIALVLSLSATAQNSGNLMEAPQGLSASEYTQTPVSRKSTLLPQSQSTPIWSEDFSNGIPSGWSNQGYSETTSGALVPDASCNWEFRGTNTTPDYTTGSRGQYTTGNTIASQTPTDFVIFDSDYLDNSGTSPLGSGVSPAPHVGTLTTDTIDLSGQTEIEIVFHTYARVYASEFKLAFSSDGGMSFPDTVEVMPGLAINSSTKLNDRVFLNVSPYIGGSANAMVSFIFDGRSAIYPAGSADGLFFWQIDDIEIRNIPDHRLNFAEQPAGGFIDMATNGTFDQPDYGHIMLSESEPVQFDAMLTNSGTATQHNIRFNIDVYDAANNLVQTASSPPVPVLNPQDTIHYTQLLTSNINFNATDQYSIISYATSDSISKANNDFSRNPDTLHISVNDSIMSLDFGKTDNYVGTNSLASGELLAMGVQLNLNNSQDLKGVYTGLSSVTDPLGTLIFEVYDTTGFTFGFGGPSGSPLAVQSVQLSSANVNAGGIYATLNSPVTLPAGGYYLIMSMVTSNPNEVIRVPNDKSIRQGNNSVMQSDAGMWFRGFNNSLTFNAPHIRAVFEKELDVNINVTNVSCKGGNDGAASVTVNTPGTYTYLWSNNSTSNSISNVAAGSYTLTITQTGSSQSFNYNITISEPQDSVEANATVQHENCAKGNNGSIQLNPTGAAPFDFQWNTGDTTAAISGLTGGSYSVSITDANGCTAADTFTVNAGTGSISTPLLSQSGTVNLCSGNSLLLTLNNPYTSYEWSTGGSSSNITVDTAGQYYVKVTDNNCEAWSDTLTVQLIEPYDDLELCMVSYDLNEGRNKALFTNPNRVDINSINLFKKEANTGGSFSLAGSIGSGGNQVYDSIAPGSGGLSAYEYAIGITDTCGNRSSLSTAHTSMSLQTSKTAPGHAQLLWTPYQGLSVDKYRLYKTSAPFSTFDLLDSVSASTHNYTDTAANDSGYYYVIEAVFTSSLACGNGNFDGSIMAAHYNPLSAPELSINSFRIYPNPTRSTVKVFNPENRGFNYTLLDFSGKTVQKGVLQPETNSIDISRLPSGIYLINISGVPGAQKIHKL